MSTLDWEARVSIHNIQEFFGVGRIAVYIIAVRKIQTPYVRVRRNYPMKHLEIAVYQEKSSRSCGMDQEKIIIDGEFVEIHRKRRVLWKRE